MFRGGNDQITVQSRNGERVCKQQRQLRPESIQARNSPRLRIHNAREKVIHRSRPVGGGGVGPGNNAIQNGTVVNARSSWIRVMSPT